LTEIGVSNKASRESIESKTQMGELNKSCELLRDKELRDFYRMFSGPII